MTDTRSDSLEGLEALRTKIERDSRGQFGPSMLDVVRMSGIYEAEIQRLQARLSTTEALQQELGEAQVRIETDGRLIALLEGRITSTQDLLRRAESDLTKVAADCHRSKWEFQEGENERPVVNRVMRKAFDTLHRIGDVANIAARSLSERIRGAV